jgi:hypothetical protein
MGLYRHLLSGNLFGGLRYGMGALLALNSMAVPTFGLATEP